MNVLSLIIFLPLAGALALLAIPRENVKALRLLALLSAIATFAASVWLWVQFNNVSSDFQFVEKYPWVEAFGIQYFLGVDGLSLPMVLLTTFLTVLAMIGSFHITDRVKEYFFLLLVLEMAMLGVFLALDLFLFYVFWEMTPIPIYFLVGMWGGPQKNFAAIKFFLVTLFGSLFMLAAILGLYFHTTPNTFDYTEILRQSGAFARMFQLVAFGCFFIGFAVKIPVFPFHTWLPLAHVEAPTAVSTILAGILLKIGAYGLLRFSFTLFPVAVQELAVTMAVLAVINIVYGAFCSLAQTDIKRMIAYSSINHMGYVLLGLSALNIVGFHGAVLQMVNHGIITGCLFLLVGVLYDRAHTRDINAFGGLANVAPVYTGMMMVACFASLGMPLLSGFVGEFLCFLGAFQDPRLRVMTGISLLGLLLTAAFFVVLIRRVFWGSLPEKWKNFRDMDAREMMATIPLVLAMIVLGIYPSFLLAPMNETLTAILGLAKRVIP